MVAQAGGAAGIVLINDQEGSSMIHCHISFYFLLVFYFLLFGDYVSPISSGNDTFFSCYSLDLVEMACPNNSTVSNITIPVVTISKAGGDVIDKYISAGKKGKVLASCILPPVSVKVNFLLILVLVSKVSGILGYH